MKSRPTKFGTRENTASSRRHASRLAVDSLPSKSEAIPRGSQHRQPTPVSTYRASESNMSIITMPLEGATGGETGDSAETFSAPTAVITAKESRQVLLTPWKSLLTSYPPSGIEVCEPEEAEGDSRPAGGRAGRHAAGRIAAPWPLPLVTLIWYVR